MQIWMKILAGKYENDCEAKSMGCTSVLHSGRGVEAQKD